jgi:hypothetical protein
MSTLPLPPVIQCPFDQTSWPTANANGTFTCPNGHTFTVTLNSETTAASATTDPS